MSKHLRNWANSAKQSWGSGATWDREEAQYSEASKSTTDMKSAYADLEKEREALKKTETDQRMATV